MRFDHDRGLPVDERPTTIDMHIAPLRFPDVVLWIAPLRVYSDGIGFTVTVFGRVIMSADGQRIDPDSPAGKVNLGYVYHPGIGPWLRLEAAYPDGRQTHNDPSNSHRPDDPEQPWLRAAGGIGQQGVARSADFLLTPLPGATGPLTLTVAYPELGMPPTDISLDTSMILDAAARVRTL